MESRPSGASNWRRTRFSTVEKARSARNEIAAPRIFDYQRLGSGWSKGTVLTPQQAREWVRWATKNGVDGIKLALWPTEGPEVFKAAIDEASKLGLGRRRT
jgi:hypothetical protein